jgi:hypothetical protein
MTLRPGITVVIPSIPPRRSLLRRAVTSVLAQTMPAAALSVVVDSDRLGAAVTRQRALDAVNTRWVAFLDDDDEMKPNHLEALFSAAVDYDALYLWSRFQVALPKRGYRVPGFRGAEYELRDGPEPLGAGTFEQWNPRQPAQTTITTLVSTELARDVGGFTPPPVDCSICPVFAGVCEHAVIDGQRAGEDWDFTLRCVAAASPARFRHVPEVTWLWHHHENNTSGLPDRW